MIPQIPAKARHSSGLYTSGFSISDGLRVSPIKWSYFQPATKQILFPSKYIYPRTCIHQFIIFISNLHWYFKDLRDFTIQRSWFVHHRHLGQLIFSWNIKNYAFNRIF